MEFVWSWDSVGIRLRGIMQWVSDITCLGYGLAVCLGLREKIILYSSL